jgi:oligopeptide transport system substrate-binding protein
VKKTAFIFIIVFLFISCEKKQNINNVLRTCIYSDPSSLDPRKTSDYISTQILLMLYRGLMHYSSKQTLECSLCESYKISEDKTKYIFFLKKAFWSNGERITAYDFERSLKTILDPNFPSVYAELLYPIKNAEKAKMGLLPLSKVKIKAKSDKILKITLDKPNPYFLFLTTLPIYFPVYEREINSFENSNNTTNLVSSGPFILQKWDRNNQIILRKNPHFYNEKKISLNGINISIIPNEETAFEMYENDQIDFLSSFLSPLSVETLSEIKKRKDSTITALAGYSYLSFNTEKFPFTNKNIRKAFSLAIDRQKIVDNITQLDEPIAKRIIPKSFLKEDDKILIEHNPKLAKKLFLKGLKELKTTKDKLDITFSFGSYVVHRKEALALKQMFEDTLEIPIKLKIIDDKSLLAKLHMKDYEFALARVIVRYNDPLNLFEKYKYKNQAKNYPLWENKDFTNLLSQAKNEIDYDKRLYLIEMAEKIMIDEMPIAPMYFYNYTKLCKSYLKGIYSNIVGDLLFEEAKIEKDKI